ncbi:hypothetical protein DJ268_15165 [Salmonella enterica subsp. enterica serovar Newport]|nr:hypothetical protein [Salmonella enterica subsp. enterica serovar Newport]
MNTAIRSANHLKVRFIQQSPWLPTLAGNLSCRINDHFQKMKNASSS